MRGFGSANGMNQTGDSYRLKSVYIFAPFRNHQSYHEAVGTINELMADSHDQRTFLHQSLINEPAGACASKHN